MSALDELIYDRTQADVTYAAELNRKLGRGETLTAQELADWNAGLKGAYNAADMNRVDAAVRELGGMLTVAGYPVEYVDPRQDTPSGGSNEIMLTASDFQSGFLYYDSGNHSPSDNYLCTQTFIAVQPNVTVAVRTNASLSSDCGFINAGIGVFTGGANVSKGFAHGDVIPRPPARDYWMVGDIIEQEAWTQYIVNVQSLRDAYYTMPDSPKLPEPTAPLNFDGANAIEKLLYDISQLYDAMIASYRPCGSFKCGSNTQHLPLQRSVI